MKPGSLAVISTLIALAAAPSQTIAASDVEVLDAWIAEAPPVSRVHAGYLRIRNNGDTRIAITGMTCMQYARTEFHRTVDREGVARMVHQLELGIEPGEMLVMQPGGYHVMLFEPVERLQAGDETGCEILFDDRRLPVTLQVRKSAELHDHSHHHH